MAALPVAFPPPLWKNQNIVLYHGTVDRYAGGIVSGPIHTSRGKPRRDFGPGFYTTTDRQQAYSWATQVAALQPGTSPALIEIVVDREGLAKLDVMGFIRGDFAADDFWSFIHFCRQGARNHARPLPQPPFYDAVYGPVAAFWNQRMSIANADQISFHTARAERLLNASARRRLI